MPFLIEVNIMYGKFKTIVNGIMAELLFTNVSELVYKDFHLTDGRYRVTFHVGGIFVGRESMSGTLMIMNKNIYDTVAYVTHRPLKVSRHGIIRVMIEIVRELIANPILKVNHTSTI